MMMRFKICVPYRSDSQGDWDEVRSGKLIVWVGDHGEAITVPVPKMIRELREPVERAVLHSCFAAQRSTPITMKFQEQDDQGMWWTVRQATQALGHTVSQVPSDWFGLFGVEAVHAAEQAPKQAA